MPSVPNSPPAALGLTIPCSCSPPLSPLVGASGRSSGGAGKEPLKSKKSTLRLGDKIIGHLPAWHVPVISILAYRTWRDKHLCLKPNAVLLNDNYLPVTSCRPWCFSMVAISSCTPASLGRTSLILSLGWLFLTGAFAGNDSQPISIFRSVHIFASTLNTSCG
jgi:hypothetical protein